MNKRIIFAVIFISLLGLVSFVSAAQIINPLGATNSFSALLANIISGVGTVLATLGTIMIIVAGILYLTSAGSPEKIGTAKKALIYAIVGIAIGLAAGAIVEVIKTTIGAPPTP